MSNEPKPETPPPALWDAWGDTPQSAMKRVSVGRSFTAISAYWQFQRATELFGPVGYGWFWSKPEVEYLYLDEPAKAMMVLRVDLTVNWQGEPCTIPLINAHKLYDKRGIDDEAWKKLLTDTLTKGLSYFGCSSDVFLGCYDDNRYVAAANNETRKRKEPEPEHAQESPLSDKEMLETRKFLYAAIKQHGARLGLTAVAMRELCRTRTGFESVVDMNLDELEAFTRLLSESSTLEDANNA